MAARAPERRGRPSAPRGRRPCLPAALPTATRTSLKITRARWGQEEPPLSPEWSREACRARAGRSPRSGEEEEAEGEFRLPGAGHRSLRAPRPSRLRPAPLAPVPRSGPPGPFEPPPRGPRAAAAAAVWLISLGRAGRRSAQGGGSRGAGPGGGRPGCRAARPEAQGGDGVLRG